MITELDKLIGTWRSDPMDRGGKQAYGNITLKFSGDKSLLYIRHESGRDEVARLTFRIEPGFIITDQPSAPRNERTAYEFTADGKLILVFGGERSRYIRVA